MTTAPGIGRGGIDGGASDIRDWLARELHDSVSSRLTTMLVEMELLRRREGSPPELEGMQREIRKVLLGLRQLLHTLRQSPAPDLATAALALERKLMGAAGDWSPPDDR